MSARKLLRLPALLTLFLAPIGRADHPVSCGPACLSSHESCDTRTVDVCDHYDCRANGPNDTVHCTCDRGHQVTERVNCRTVCDRWNPNPCGQTDSSQFQAPSWHR
jgi:hypothetical protein